MSALAALTLRTLSGTLRDADLLFAVLAPVGCFLGFTLALGNLIHTGQMTYPQYVRPVVIVQAMLFGAMTTADRAARDRLSGFGVRLRTLPIPAVVPVAARMLYCLIRAVIALIAGVAVASVFGFRMGSVESSSQLLLLPQLVLVLLSTGMAPAELFPGWLGPFVRYQPVSQVTETLRGLASGHGSGAGLAVTVAWCIALMALFGGLALGMQRRTRWS